MYTRIQICCISDIREAETAIRYGVSATGKVAWMPGMQSRFLNSSLKVTSYVGLSASTYCSLNRFHRSLNQLLRTDYTKLSDLAVDNDFFDQTHFTKEFKRFAGNTPEQVVEKADVINSFISQQDGFIDSELVRTVEGNTWYFIYHIENMEKLKAVGEKIRNIRLFGELIPLIEPDSMKVSFCQKVKSW